MELGKKMSPRLPISEPTKRLIRQAAFFGCSICGNPLLEYAHIMPYEKSQDNSVENLIALCPNHHTEYDLGDFSREQIRDYKLNPFNKGRDVSKTFNIRGRIPIIEAGTNICRNTPVLLFVDEKNIVTLHKQDNQLLLNALFYDKNNLLLAYIRNNEWHTIDKQIWDVVYRTVARELTIRTKPRDIMLKLRIKKGIVHFSGKLYYNGFKVQITKNKMMVGHKSRSIDHCKFDKGITVVSVDTKRGDIDVASPKHEHEYETPLVTLLRSASFGALYKTFLIPRGCKFYKKYKNEIGGKKWES
jgi:hypothetical protein